MIMMMMMINNDINYYQEEKEIEKNEGEDEVRENRRLEIVAMNKKKLWKNDERRLECH